MLFSSNGNGKVTPRRALIEDVEESAPRRKFRIAPIVSALALVVLLLGVGVGDTQATSASGVPVVAAAQTATSTTRSASDDASRIPKVAKSEPVVNSNVESTENFTATVVAEPQKAAQEPSEAPRKPAKTKRVSTPDNPKLEAAEVPKGSGSTSKKAAPKVTGTGKGAKALAFAKRQIGEPYVRNADGPGSWDCSGLTMKAWAAAGVKGLPHSAHLQARHGKKVSKSHLRPGDLVFFYHPIHHVAIYAGKGKVIHAPKPGSSVTYIPMKYMTYAGAVRPGS